MDGDTFEVFWRAYPRHVNKGEAERVFSRLVQSGVDPVLLVSKAKSLARHTPPEELKWVPAPAKWLSEGRYDDVDLFTDQANAEANWFRGCWERVDVAAVEAKLQVKMPRVNPPEGVEDIGVITAHYKAKAREWIAEVGKRDE